VTVCIPCFDHEDEVGEAIGSVAAQDFGALELLALDDGSGDRSLAAMRAELEARPWLPSRLLAGPINAGLPRARNRMAAAARGELVLMLDADNVLYPPAVGRLVAALDADPGAFFAYPTLQGHVEGEPHGLLSYRAWDPALLARRNIVDALALLRRDRLLELGGYVDDVRMYGWEDYDLWARAAEHGERGVHVAEILARYRRGSSSMLSITDLDTQVMLDLLRERYPRTMGTLEVS
jgi:glycosyltransferase involved in cell wall biosynthesis